MPFFDLPLDDLERYAPAVREPSDFDEFWADTLAEARSHDGDPVVVETDAGLTEITVHDVTFPGFAGEPVRAWLRLPRRATTAPPVIIVSLPMPASAKRESRKPISSPAR